MTAPAPPVLAGGLGRLRLARVEQLLVDPMTPGALAGGRGPAMAACFHACAAAGIPFVFGWLRPHPAGPITVVTTAPVTGAGLIYPPAASGQFLDADTLAALLAELPYWTGLAVTADSLVTTADTPPPPPLDDTLLDAWSGPFGWLLYAIPLDRAETGEAAATAADAERTARTRTDSPTYQVRADRAQARHWELSAAESTGAWRLHLLAAGTTGAAALTVAGLLAAAVDVTPQGYTLVPAGSHGTLDDALAAATAIVGTPLVAALAQPPTYGIPGVMVRPRLPFDVVTPAAGKGLRLGQQLDRSGRLAGDVLLPMAGLVQHTFVAGATGMGKTTTVQQILREATAAGVPWLVIEPAKAEYAVGVGGPITVLRIGALDQAAAGINPLRPAAGFPLRTHADRVKAMLIASFRAEEPFPQIISAAVEAAYVNTGWDISLGAPANPDTTPRWPTLADLRHAAAKTITATGYSDKVEADVHGFLNIRLTSLTLGAAGQFLATGHDLDIADLLTRNVIIELEDVGDDTDKALIMGAILLRLTEHLRVLGPTGGRLRHLTVIEEAHRLLRRPSHDGPAAHAVETIAAMLAEVRAYGEGLIIADQIPTKLIPDVVKNTTTKIVHRLPSADDRDAVGSGMNLTPEQVNALGILPRGTAVVFTDGMHASTPVRIPLSGAPPRPLTVMAASTVHDSCANWCATQPVTTREQVAVHAFLARNPMAAVWADLAVLGHLLALPHPAPDATTAATLTGLAARRRELVLRQAVSEAAAARSPATAYDINPDAFVGHITGDLLRHLDGTPGCPDPAHAWSLPAFVHNPIRLALLQTLHTDPHAGPHPDTSRWEAAIGRRIPGDAAHSQRDTVDGWCAQAQAAIHPNQWTPLVLGAPARLPVLLHVAPASRGWDPAIRRLSAQMPATGGWPITYLSAAALQQHQT